MQTVNKQTITIDLKKSTIIQMPHFIQGDTNILEIIIKENGEDADLNNIGRIVANYERPDKEVIPRLLTKSESNKVEYKLGIEENEVKGYGEMDIKFFSLDNLERISTKTFKVFLAASLGSDKIYENTGDLTLLQELFVEVESIKQSAENEDARVTSENLRQSAETDRNTKENERRAAESSRVNVEKNRAADEMERLSNELIRQQQEEERQNNTAAIISTAQQAILKTELATQYATESGEYAVGKANEAEALGNYAKQQGNRAQQIVDENKTIWLKPVINFAAISTTYPNPIFGSKVITMDDQKEYRFTTIWEWTGIYSSNGVTALQAQLADANRQSQTLTHGTSIFASALNSPVEFEVQGRTLTSLGNSNLEGNKMYVLADKKTWLRAEGREGTQIKGVAKFTKSASFITKADYSGKVSGSVSENAHIAKYAIAPLPLKSPSEFTSEISTLGYGRINTLNGTVEPLSNNGNGNVVQMLFSKNIIEHIERKHGRIPADTVAGKVQWIKDNVQRLTANWHGWGSSVGGNGVKFAAWNGVEWMEWANHSSGVVSKLSCTLNVISWFNAGIRSDGFIHYLAYTTNPSDGVTPSQLNTDFIELEVELKSTVVLDTRPIITRVSNFEGKVSGDLVSNPHVFKHANRTALDAPSNWVSEFATSDYDRIARLDGVLRITNVLTAGQYATHLMSFNLIEEVERNIGRIPKATIPEKVQWLKDWVEILWFDWYGQGNSVGGNKANINSYNYTGVTWRTAVTHTSSSVTKLTFSVSGSSTIANTIDPNGIVSYLAYAEPSDGVTPSTINTDYCELQISFKQGATLHDPILPLYEVDATDYANILVSWDETQVMARYPKVMGCQHLQNLAVISEGENLIVPFNEWNNLHANFKVVSPYEGELNATADGQGCYVLIDVVPNQNYYFSKPTEPNTQYAIYNEGATASISAYTSNSNFTFNSGNNKKVSLYLRNTGGARGLISIKQPMLTLGNVAKPFVQRNPSYLFAPVKLGQIGTVKDSLFKSDGQWTLVDRVKKDVVLDGSLVWSFHTDFAGYKSVYTTAHIHPNGNSNTPSLLTKYNGSLVLKDSVSGANNLTNYDKYIATTTSTVIAIADIDTGFGETYSPTAIEIQAYFNGWQAKTVDVNGKPTAWRSLGDGTDAPTQTLVYVSTNKAPNFTPYKLSYVLANPQTLNVNHLVEGDIAVSGSTQVEVTSGVVVREKANPVLSGAKYYINSFNASSGASRLKNKLSKFMMIYKNGQSEIAQWTIDGQNANGNFKAEISQDKFDTTATYEVTYLVLDRHLHTVNSTEVKASYAGNFKEIQDMQVEKVSDLATQQSILANQMYRVLVAAKGAGWNV
jgi:hypothetical protein